MFFWDAFFNVDDMAEEENINFDDGIKTFLLGCQRGWLKK